MQDPVVFNQNQQIMTIVTLYFTFDKDFNKQQPSWDVILQELLERFSPPSISTDVKSHSKTSSSTDRKNSKPSCSSDSSSPAGLDLLSMEQWESFEEKYRSMDNDSKWKLGDVFVEDIIYEYAKGLKYEHAAHSFILNLADKRWQKVFTQAQLREIENKSFVPLPTLPQELTDFFNKFKNVNNLDDAWKIADESRFDPVREFDADCAKRTVLNVIAGYRWDTINRIGRNGKERDVMRLWRAIDDSFDDLKADVFRSDQLSSSSSSRHNEERNAIDGSIKQKVLGAKPDLIISKNMIEFAAAEQGYSDEAGCGVKELSERYLKLPKNLKDMLLKIGCHLDNDRKSIRAVRTVGFSHTHLRMTGLIMDAPCGYVCRVRELKEITIPCEFERFAKTYIRFLKHVFILKYVVKNTMDIVKNGPPSTVEEEDDEEEDTEMFESIVDKHKDTLIIPSCLNRIGDRSKKILKKRKIDEIIENNATL
ncbi:hypothetical protein INT45_003901 [Circinella minor]|uniref:Uncharacterized protein n=1 Tax=Circinella minor TaxID=1195481 RepID=A0A8H7SDL5_9FUNG|nr:hypothetical protein INT45_003901 [Circinella minor]